jgi:hypothetical protein
MIFDAKCGTGERQSCRFHYVAQARGKAVDFIEQGSGESGQAKLEWHQLLALLRELGLDLAVKETSQVA